MTEALAAAVQQLAQQTSNQTVTSNPGPLTGSRSFETYLQQTGGQDGKQAGISGSGIQDRLDKLEGDLADKLRSSNGKKTGPDMIPVELLDNKSRLGLLKEAYRQTETSGSAGGFESKFIQVENEYKQVEAIMSSEKDLSPGELLALQARLYQVSQHIEVMSKVVDQMAGGIKTVLNTNV
ncbi:MAG: hypothetical protein OEM82_06850 [Acidobacteriota bacterium]|nr:hypothetical protein [Acidobacteriota bacterium]MDH3529327.1 hypothetical protein [Acidobacteriota bacterium]